MIRARKRFGQHFLHDPAVLERIVEAIAPQATDRLAEIGPGRGALTRHLLAAPHDTLDAVEIDRDLAGLLREEFAAEKSFLLHEADALEFDFAALARQRGGRLRLAGNLPYNISTPLLFHLLEQREAIEDLHCMLQREVVERIVAREGDAAYGRLSVMLAPWIEAEHLFDVGPGAFQPAPKVWSAVLRISIRAQPVFAVSPHFTAVVAQAFSHRRKTLRNALKGLSTETDFAACGVDPGSRAETVAPSSFNALASRLDVG